MRSSSAASATIANLEVLKLCLQLFDGTVRHLEILVQTITLSDKLQ